MKHKMLMQITYIIYIIYFPDVKVCGEGMHVQHVHVMTGGRTVREWTE